MEGRMKGQFFIIAAIITILILVLIKTNTQIGKIIETKRYVEANLESKELVNVEEQLEKVLSYSFNKNIFSNAKKFLRYAKLSFFGRGKELKILSIANKYENAVASAANTLEVEILNLLDTTISQLNVSFSYDFTQNKTFENVEENETISTTFTFSFTVPDNYTLYVTYLTPSEQKTYSVRIPIEEGSKFVGYFDIRLEGLVSKNEDEMRVEVEIK